MTVSRALRHHPDLAESTKELVLKKAEELGYRKHLKKASDSGNSRNSRLQQRVGIVLFEDDRVGNLDLFRSEIVRRIFLSIQRECLRLGVETLVETPPEGSTESPMLVKNRSVEGIFLLGRYSSNITERLGGLPSLAVSNYIECSGLPRVTADNFHGMREATEHLIELGHRKILFLGDKQGLTQIFHERSFGYLAAMQSHRLKPNIDFCDYRHEAAPVEKILRHTAVVCSNDSLAYHVKRDLLQVGTKVPQDCSLVSFDNVSALHDSLPITSYEPDWELLGRTAAELLISSRSILEREICVTVPGKLVLQSSTCPPPDGR